MAGTNWNQRFLSTTRGRIITLLRRASRSVDELAQALDLTHTAVRAHLAALERDGLVQQRSERLGNRKPSSVYDLAPTAEFLFPQSYSQLLYQLLEVLQERMTPEEGDDLLRTVGRRMAAQWTIPPGELSVRMEAAVEVLNELGGLMERETGEETLCIRGYRCPFAAVVLEHPAVCRLAETLLTELVGVPVQEHCEYDGVPRCCFTVVNA
jgi:predicted ArsR family transcriptional regulator